MKRKQTLSRLTTVCICVLSTSRHLWSYTNVKYLSRFCNTCFAGLRHTFLALLLLNSAHMNSNVLTNGQLASGFVLNSTPNSSWMRDLTVLATRLRSWSPIYIVYLVHIVVHRFYNSPSPAPAQPKPLVCIVIFSCNKYKINFRKVGNCPLDSFLRP